MVMMQPQPTFQGHKVAPERSKLLIGVDNIMEILGATVLVLAIGFIFGWVWALLPLGVALLVGAEYAYTETSLRIPLPRRPHPIAKVRSALARVHGISEYLLTRRASFMVNARLLRRGVWPW